MRRILILLLLIFSNTLYAMKDEWQLKGGLTAAAGRIKTLRGENAPGGDNERYESFFFGGGFNTHFGRRFDRSEFTLSSYVIMNRIDRLTFQAGDTEVRGKGTERIVGFAPLYKYNFIANPLESSWTPYLSLGPIWALQTISLENYQLISGKYDKDYKVVISSRGVLIAAGVEENLPFKEMHPVYFELAYSYMRAYRSGIIDASNYAEVQTLNEAPIAQYVSNHLVMLSMGITIF